MSFPTYWTWAGFSLQSTSTSTTILFFHCLFKDLTPSHLWLLENTWRSASDATNHVFSCCRNLRRHTASTTELIWEFKLPPSYRLSEGRVSFPLKLAWEEAPTKPAAYSLLPTIIGECIEETSCTGWKRQGFNDYLTKGSDPALLCDLGRQ